MTGPANKQTYVIVFRTSTAAYTEYRTFKRRQSYPSSQFERYSRKESHISLWAVRRFLCTVICPHSDGKREDRSKLA